MFGSASMKPPTQSVLCTAYAEYPRTSVMRVLKILAVSSVVQLAGGAEENMKPGREGTTTLKDTFFPLAFNDGWVNGWITGRNS
jgi:hypothetical protein